MDYSELANGVKYFRRTWPPQSDSVIASYSELRKRDKDNLGYWLHLESMDSIKIADEIIDGFLNKWQCRIPVKPFEIRSRSADNLVDAVAQLYDYYACLVTLRIEDVDFEEYVTFNNQQRMVKDIIDYIYGSFLRIETRFGPVPASKLMHMALPDLFVMWDRGIIQKHCIPIQRLSADTKKTRSYVGFLVLMQENIKHIIQSHPKTSQLTGQAVVEEIRKAHGNLSLPRLLDMANMSVRDCEQAICIQCMKKARARWARLGYMAHAESESEDSGS